MRTTIVIAIGRNVGDTLTSEGPSRPMDARSWEDFITATTDLVLGLNGTIFTRARGKGEWDGGSEDSYVLVAAFPTALLDLLRSNLAALARDNGQEGIGLVVNDNGTESVVWA